MSDEPSTPPESRVKLKLRSDRGAGLTPPPDSPIPPAPVAPQEGPPKPPEAPASQVPPAFAWEAPAASAPQASPPPVKLRPRISIKPSEPEPVAETVPIPDFPPLGSTETTPAKIAPAVGSEKVEVNLRPFVRPPDPELPAAAAPPLRATGDEKADSGFKFKLKPAPLGDLPTLPILPDLANFKPSEVSAVRPVAPALPVPGAPPVAGVPSVRAMPFLMPAPKPKTVPAPLKPKPGLLLPVLACVLAVGVAGGSWLIYRKSHANPPPAPIVKPLPAAGESSPASPVASPSTPVETPPAHETEPLVASNPTPPANGAVETTTTSAAANSVPVATVPGPVATPVPTPAPQVAPPPPAPSDQFRAFVDRLKIAGVRIGPPARIFVEHTTVRAGDVIDGGLGVFFVGIDSATNELVFMDKSGAAVRRHF